MTRFTRPARRWLAAALLALCIAPALADDYPSKPIRIVVPWPAGGLVDVVARVVGDKLHESLGQPAVVENRPGAAGNIGAELVARAQPDGYTLLVGTTAMDMNDVLQPGLPFRALTDFDPITVVATSPSILVVNPRLPVKSVADLVALAKSEPGKLTYASAGNGTPAHLAAELFKTMAGIDAVHVPYKGAPPAMVDVMAGRVDFFFANATVSLPQIQAGKVRALAVTSSTRWSAMPGLPTVAEAGVPGFEATQWVGILAPHGTPKVVVDRLAAAIRKALDSPDAKAALQKAGMDVAPADTPQAFGALMRRDTAKWRDVVQKAHVKVD